MPASGLVGQRWGSTTREGPTMTGNPWRIAYRGAIAVALAASFLQIWVNLAVGIVGEPDNPANQGFYGVVAAAAACAFTARLRR